MLVRGILALVLFALAGGAADTQGGDDEYRLKAAFLLSFPRFVEWPERSLGRGEPLIVAVYGQDPFGNALARAAGSKVVDDHPLMIHRTTSVELLRSCHIVFVAGVDAKRLQHALEVLEGAPVLTVGEGEEFLQAGGIIGLVLEERKVRFEINAGAARSAGLRISSSLLALARRVSEQ